MLPEHIKDAIQNYLPHMQGWTTPERGAEMAEKILEIGAKVSVDIGVFGGRSTIAMGFAARQLGHSMVYGIDPWSPEVAAKGDDVRESAEWWRNKSNLENIHREAMNTIWAHRLDQWVTIIRQQSKFVHQLFPQIDVLNIDGAHGEEASCADVTLYASKVKPGGFIFFDDVDWETTKAATSMLDSTCELVSDTGKARTYRKR